MGEFDTEYTSHPTCPHCGKANNSWWEWGDELHDGNVMEEECGWCCEPIRISVHVDVRFTVEKREGGEDEG